MAAQAPSSWGTNLSTNPNGNIAGMFYLTFTNSFTAVGANTTSTQSYTLSGLQAGDLVLVQKRTAQTGLLTGSLSYVTTANTLPVTFVNASGGSITPTASDTYTVVVLRPLYTDLTTLPVLNEYGQS